MCLQFDIVTELSPKQECDLHWGYSSPPQNFHRAITELSPTTTNYHQLSPNNHQLSLNPSKNMTCIEDTPLLQHIPHISLQRFIWLLLWNVCRNHLQYICLECEWEMWLWVRPLTCVLQEVFLCPEKRFKMIIGHKFIFKHYWKKDATWSLDIISFSNRVKRLFLWSPWSPWSKWLG